MNNQKNIITKTARTVSTIKCKDMSFVCEYIYSIENSRVYCRCYINGEYKGKSMVFAVKTEPYTKGYNQKYYLTGDDLAAVKSLYE